MEVVHTRKSTFGSSLESGDVMSRKMQITNGPSFRHFISATVVIAEVAFDSTFTMDGDIHKDMTTIHKEKNLFQVSVFSMGRLDIKKKPDEYIFLAMKDGFEVREMKSYLRKWFYVIHFDVVTRKGHCVEYTEEEWLSFSVIREMMAV